LDTVLAGAFFADFFVRVDFFAAALILALSFVRRSRRMHLASIWLPVGGRYALYAAYILM
jgi:hypothetical protein